MIDTCFLKMVYHFTGFGKEVCGREILKALPLKMINGTLEVIMLLMVWVKILKLIIY